MTDARTAGATAGTTPVWFDGYRGKLRSAREALNLVSSGDRVFIHPGTAEPEALVLALIARASELRDVEVVHLLTSGNADYVRPDMEGHFRHRAFFVGANVREAVNTGKADYVPIHLHAIPQLFSTGQCAIDVCLVHVSPPDEHGFCSLGVGVDVTKAAARHARKIVAQVNPRMPRTLGDSFLHVSKFDAVVEVDAPILELPRRPLGEVESEIGRHVASLIDDGATLQMGIGGIPDGVLFYLKNKRDLGIHTEMFSDGVMELIQAGVINNERKTLHTGKVLTSFLMGTQALYDFVDNNPIVEMRPTEYVNDPFVIAQNDDMVAINSAIQVDLSGQVCSDSIGLDVFSGFGGQVDFIRGAARARRGKPIIALPSTARKGTVSRIVPRLTDGAGVVTSRADVHYVITEYGIASLFGRSLRERLEALAAIAHPDFRGELHDFGRARKLFV